MSFDFLKREKRHASIFFTGGGEEFPLKKPFRFCNISYIDIIKILSVSYEESHDLTYYTRLVCDLFIILGFRPRIR